MATRQVYIYESIATMPDNRNCRRVQRRYFAAARFLLRWYLDLVNRTVYLMLWVFEVLAVVGLVLALTVPTQDYALREFLQWQQHP